MNDRFDDEVWRGVERRLAAIETLVPEPPSWQPTREPAVRVTRGAAFGPPGGRRPATRPLVGAFIVVGLIAALILGSFVIGSARPAPQVSPTAYLIGGRALAGPTCGPKPASPLPGECAPRPVSGAVLVIDDSAGHEIRRVTTTADGTWSASVPAGAYTVIPQPVVGLFGTPAPVLVTVNATSIPTGIEIDYFTGIV